MWVDLEWDMEGKKERGDASVGSCFHANTYDGYRLSAQELLECSFLAVEPDVQLLATDPSHKLLTLQVVFKGSDKVSVKFEFNVVMYQCRWLARNDHG